MHENENVQSEKAGRVSGGDNRSERNMQAVHGEGGSTGPHLQQRGRGSARSQDNGVRSFGGK